MYEINKLRIRLKNVGKNVAEYRMTVAEAKDLLDEIDVLLIPKVIPVVKEIIREEAPSTRVFDGGSF